MRAALERIERAADRELERVARGAPLLWPKSTLYVIRSIARRALADDEAERRGP